MSFQAASPAASHYDPRYDPLIDTHPGHGRGYAPTYWVATAGEPPEDDGPVSGDQDVDVAIIGSGFTGLCCAIFLARRHGIRATVLEGQPGRLGLFEPQRRPGAARLGGASAARNGSPNGAPTPPFASMPSWSTRSTPSRS